jgi:thiamine-phosphate pyrophosphorylase
MLRYAITSRALYPGGEQEKQAALLKEAAQSIAQGIEFIQLREKDLSAATLAAVARNLLEKIDLTKSPTRLLINSRPDVALAAGAHGVHLSASPDELSPTQVNELFRSAGRPKPLITTSCHTLAEVHHARLNQVDAILFAPVFEKRLTNGQEIPGQGLEQLRAACTAATPIPVFALGGVTLQNTPDCLNAGAAGVAGIRLFHHIRNDLPQS